jgi:hypothetical protein
VHPSVRVQLVEVAMAPVAVSIAVSVSITVPVSSRVDRVRISRMPVAMSVFVPAARLSVGRVRVMRLGRPVRVVRLIMAVPVIGGPTGHHED